MRLSAGGLGLGLTSYQITICRFALGAGGGAFVMAPECYSHSRVLEAMNGIHEQAQEASLQVLSFPTVPGVGFKFRRNDTTFGEQAFRVWECNIGASISYTIFLGGSLVSIL